MKPVIISDAELWLGDCAEILPLIGKVDAVITDPPYGIGERKGTISKARNRNNYENFDDTPEAIKNEIVPRFELALSLANRAIMTPGGKCFSMYPAPVDIGMSFQPATSSMTHWGRATCQPIFYYGKDPMAGKTIKPIHYQLTEAPEKNGHPCPKPIGFMMWMVDRGSLNGEVILDPFMGSGTTGVACVQLGRKFIGIERDERYFEIACQRIERAVSQGQLFAPAPVKQIQEPMF
jgi:site-specific DNA-methyltransferase (adenine-specific)/modification methylase